MTTRSELAAMIDHTLLKPEATDADVRALVAEAAELGTYSVCVSPSMLPVEVPAGSTLWFHSRTPHRSGPNHSPVPRRALYPTYNALSEGDLREAYYREKLERFAAEGERSDGKVKVSLIDDFQGDVV